MVGRHAVFLDRDGVLNRAVVREGRPYPPDTLEAVEIPEDVPEALRRLKAAGFYLSAATNQPDVTRGTQRKEVVEAINAKLLRELPLDELRVCYDDGDTPRRKPRPGMLLEAAEEHGLSLENSFMIGDRWRDVEAGQRAGCRTIFLDLGYTEKKPDPPADCTVKTVSAAVEWILEQWTLRARGSK